MIDPQPLRLQTLTLQRGEKLRGELLLPPAVSSLAQARQVTIRAWGRVRYVYTRFERDEWREDTFPGSMELSLEWPSRDVPALPFELVLPDDVPPSYQGNTVVISWEVIASVQAEDGKELRRWSQPFELGLDVTTHPPEELIPRAPPSSSLTAASSWGCLLVPIVPCFVMPLSMLFGDLLKAGRSHSPGGRAVGILACLVVLALGVVLMSWTFIKARTVSKFKAASLLPLAKRFPLGGTARLRVFVDCARPLTLRGATLELAAYESIKKVRATDGVVKVPAQLHRGLNQFDVELPIPRKFPPTFKDYLTCKSTLSLQLEGLEPMILHGQLELSRAVLERAAEEEQGKQK